MELDKYRASLDAWLEQHLSALQPDHAGLGSLDDQMEQLAKVKRLTFEADWMRWGWPERVGGLGGSILLRSYLGEALTALDLVEPGLYLPEELVEGREELARVLNGVRRLPEDRREALIMRFALGMDNREIARALGRSDGATKVLIHRAVKQLEGLVNDPGEEEVHDE